MIAPDSGDGVKLFRPPLLLIDGAEDDHARHKEENEGQDALAKAPGNGEDQSINQRAKNGCKFSRYGVESEKLSAIGFRGEKTLKRAGRRLAPTQDHTCQDAQYPILPLRAPKEPQDVCPYNHQNPNHQGKEDRPLVAKPIREQAEYQRSHKSGPLHHEEVNDQLFRSHSQDLGPKDGGHDNDRLNAVIIDEKRHQELAQFPIVAHLSQSTEDPSKPNPQVGFPTGKNVAPPRLTNPEEHGKGKNPPPHGDGEETVVDGKGISPKSQPVGVPQHDEVDGQERPAPDVTQGPTQARYATDGLIRRDFRQETVVENITPRKPDISQDEEEGTKPIISFPDEI